MDDFNPRPPRGGRRKRIKIGAEIGLFQSTPPARGATMEQLTGSVAKHISIHAPREGGDDGACNIAAH